MKMITTKLSLMPLLFGLAFFFLTSLAGYVTAGAHVEAIPVKIVNPEYPRRAAVEGIEGSVTFEFSLNKNGSPTNIKVLNAIPDQTFVVQASKAIKQWVFEVNNSQDNKYRYTLEFKL
ncbi:energy transducer TonB [Aliikangiella sp. G2MR2-5]|uniref:energy transducer TonB n=1 Tax=Aliikangiella sp. G2MR2-5 TaxID=2788943 RepID=UPI0018AA7596|nr:energy transducer TonB [Aliikangiella sp. G2MR2-5]